MPKDKTPQMSGTISIGHGLSPQELSLSMFASFKVSARQPSTGTCGSGFASNALPHENTRLFTLHIPAETEFFFKSFAQLVQYSASGLKVASLRVENEESQPYKGVRSVTTAGCFEIRC